MAELDGCLPTGLPPLMYKSDDDRYIGKHILRDAGSQLNVC